MRERVSLTVRAKRHGTIKVKLGRSSEIEKHISMTELITLKPCVFPVVFVAREPVGTRKVWKKRKRMMI